MTSTGNCQKISASATLVIENFSQITTTKQQTLLWIDNKGISFGFKPKIPITPKLSEKAYIYLVCSNKIIGIVHFKISYLNSSSGKVNILKRQMKFIKGTQYQLNLKSYCFNEEMVKAFVSDKLTLLCEAELIKSNPNTMSQDYEALLNSGDYSDATLVIGEREFRVHKAILAACSPVFCVMFKHEQTSEARSNRVDIIDVEVDVFEQLIRYMYTGRVMGLDRLAIELMVVAEKYQVHSLKDICEGYLGSNLAIESVAHIFIMADLHRAAHLRSKCIDYIVRNF